MTRRPPEGECGDETTRLRQNVQTISRPDTTESKTLTPTSTTLTNQSRERHVVRLGVVSCRFCPRLRECTLKTVPVCVCRVPACVQHTTQHAHTRALNTHSTQHVAHHNTKHQHAVRTHTPTRTLNKQTHTHVCDSSVGMTFKKKQRYTTFIPVWTGMLWFVLWFVCVHFWFVGTGVACFSVVCICFCGMLIFFEVCVRVFGFLRHVIGVFFETF